MTAQSERAHAKLSPSASHRWMECPGSIRLSEGIPSTSSMFADEGTSAHELAAHCMINGYNAERFEGYYIDIAATNPKDRFLKVHGGGDRTFIVDEEMVESVQSYLDYLRGVIEPGDEVDVEFRFDLQHVSVGMFGTGDCVIYKPKTGQLYVADFKYGRGVPVDPDNNPQLLSYGLGAVARHGNRPLSNVTLVVVQPRCRHPKGPVREWTADAIDLLDFEVDLRNAALATMAPDAPLKAGDWCRFCPAAPKCAALAAQVSEIAGLEFAPDGVAPDALSPEALSSALDKVSIVESWANRLRAYAHDQAMAGINIPGFKLVEKRATRRWIDEGEVETWLKTIHDLSEDEIYVREMKSPAEMEKLMPGSNKEKRAAVLLPMITKQSSGVVLVPATDKRPPVKSDGSEFAD
jgi:Protein of unknown function (DUF2800)